jgi:hypothetical protein
MPTRLPTGGSSGQRLKSATVRACDSYRGVRLRAERILDDMDEVTGRHGIPTTDLPEDDSLVIVTQDALAAHKR